MDRRQFLRLAGIGVIGGVGLEDWAALQSMRLRNAGRPRPISDGQPTGLGGVDPIYQQVSDSDNPLAVPALADSDPLMQGYSGGLSPVVLYAIERGSVAGTSLTMVDIKTPSQSLDCYYYVPYIPAGAYVLSTSGYNPGTKTREFRFSVTACRCVFDGNGVMSFDVGDPYQAFDLFQDRYKSVPITGGSDLATTYAMSVIAGATSRFALSKRLTVLEDVFDVVLSLRYGIAGVGTSNVIGPAYLARSYGQ